MIKFRDANGDEWITTHEKVEACDKAQGRERFPAGALEATRWLEAAVQIIDQACVKGMPTLHKYKLWTMTRCARGMLNKVVKSLEDHMQSMQMVRLNDDFVHGKTKIAIGYNAREGCCNVPWSEYQYLAKLAINANCTDCLCGSKEAKTCPLRSVLEQVPQIIKDDSGFMFCPYQGMKIKED